MIAAASSKVEAEALKQLATHLLTLTP